MLYSNITEAVKSKKMLVVLIDPDKHNEQSLQVTLELINKFPPDFILVGGSLVSKSINKTIETIKRVSTLPVFLFPGNLLQLCEGADGIFLLNLISGRNPEYLIGNHVLAAPFLKSSGMEIIPTGYILVETGTKTAVEYISNTTAIPAAKTDIVVSTAMAGEMLGLKAIYLEGGSGADNPINRTMIAEVKRHISIPLIVGGGIRKADQAHQAYSAGADIVVVGNILEENPAYLEEFVKVRELL
ncbi:MAG TPA: geranylgeranylglyceryl/heptaprenylglyceryl phosphate synthase [Bacteroidales bacterium]|nr:geranylgeranylglyceryl/heptaprenylglyceryl phosphate synthase [Bacteroidales bacterium]